MIYTCTLLPFMIALLTQGQSPDFPPQRPWKAKKIVKYSCKHYKKDPLLILAVMAKESRFRTNICYQGAHGIGQFQLKSTCKKSRKKARTMGLYKLLTGIRKTAFRMNLWQRYCLREHGKNPGHHWLLHYNQGMGKCPGKRRFCSRAKRTPVTKGWIGGYAKRVLVIKKKMEARLKKMKALEKGHVDAN